MFMNHVCKTLWGGEVGGGEVFKQLLSRPYSLQHFSCVAWLNVTIMRVRAYVLYIWLLQCTIM